jgi:hypothetical protein
MVSEGSVHGCFVRIPWQWVHSSPHGGQEAERTRKGTGTGITFKGTLPVSPHLLKLTELTKISTTSWGPSVQHMRLWGTFHIQSIIFYLWLPKPHGHLIMQNAFSASPKP